MAVRDVNFTFRPLLTSPSAAAAPSVPARISRVLVVFRRKTRYTAVAVVKYRVPVLLEDTDEVTVSGSSTWLSPAATSQLLNTYGWSSEGLVQSVALMAPFCCDIFPSGQTRTAEASPGEICIVGQ
jgi:hypothetical protein